MKTIPAIVLGALLSCELAVADDRLMFGANGSTLTGTDGGAGGTIGLLHELSPGNLIGASVDHQTIADARWTFGSLRGALSRGEPTSVRWSLFGEVNYGSGRIDTRPFDHVTETAGLSFTFPRGLTLQLEDRQIDIDTTHGNLPKVGLAYLWTPRWLTGVSYSRSVSGNLGTELVSARVDYYSSGSSGRSRYNLFLGGSSGQAAPAVFNLQTGLVQPGRTMKAVFAGITKPFSRAEFTVVADYLNLSGNPTDTERFSLTVNYSIYLRAQGSPR